MEEKEQETTPSEAWEEEKDLDQDCEDTEPAEPESEPAPEQEKKIIPEQGLDTEKFEGSAPWLDGKPVDETVQGLKIEYNLRGGEVRRALRYFQKRTMYRKNTIFTVILAVIAVLYAQAIFKDPSYTMGYLMLLLSLAVIWFMWFLPARHIKAAADAVELSQDMYHMEICPQGLLMPQEDGRYLIAFDRPSIRAVEFSDFYMIIASKEKVFVLPKRCIPAEDQQELAAMLREALGPRYEQAAE